MSTLMNKRIILGVSGSIAAYKSPDIVRRLQDLGAEVRVILTSGGREFVSERSLQTVSYSSPPYELVLLGLHQYYIDMITFLVEHNFRLT